MASHKLPERNASMSLAHYPRPHPRMISRSPAGGRVSCTFSVLNPKGSDMWRPSHSFLCLCWSVQVSAPASDFACIAFLQFQEMRENLVSTCVCVCVCNKLKANLTYIERCRHQHTTQISKGENTKPLKLKTWEVVLTNRRPFQNCQEDSLIQITLKCP